MNTVLSETKYRKKTVAKWLEKSADTTPDARVVERNQAHVSTKYVLSIKEKMEADKDRNREDE